MRFVDRADAADRLTRKLHDEKIDFDIVLALPRGGVILGSIISTEFNKPLDLVIPRKVGAPGNPEIAIGAVTESGKSVWNETVLSYIDREWLNDQISGEKIEAIRRRELYLRGRDHLDYSGKDVLLVDDGIATGLTIRAAVSEVKENGAKNIYIAAPVAAPDSLNEIQNEVTGTVVLDAPYDFGAVGEYYDYFDQVSDEEVMRIMEGREKIT